MGPKKILLVDDSKTVLMLEEQILEDTPYEIIKAYNGYEAVTKALVRLPDLILMDIEMPEMDGLAACAEISKNPETSHIPVILVTSLNGEGHVAKGYLAGCREYHTKPINADSFLRTVKHYLDSK